MPAYEFPRAVKIIVGQYRTKIGTKIDIKYLPVVQNGLGFSLQILRLYQNLPLFNNC